ncbi:MAG TPA: YceI family protein [Myxococcales bacterium]|nr:YceI family protein [Myxococcales bacterium]
MLLLTLIAAQALALAPSSKVWIEGDSNLHPWACKATQSAANVEVDPASTQIAQAMDLRVSVNGLDCGEGKMNDKLRDALHADRHPFIEYHLIRAERVSAWPLRIRALGALTINGVTKPVTFVVDLDNRNRAQGKVDILMTDFGVEPPTALLVLKTYDKVTVHFDVVATAIDERRAS